MATLVATTKKNNLATWPLHRSHAISTSVGLSLIGYSAIIIQSKIFSSDALESMPVKQKAQCEVVQYILEPRFM